MVRGFAPLLLRQEFCHRQLDLPQLVARLRHRFWMNLADFANFLNLQLVHMCFLNLQLVLMCVGESSARTHDFCESSTRTHEFCESSCSYA